MSDSSHDYLAALVGRSQDGDMSAFSEIYALTYNRVYNYARHYLRDSFAAQDAVQEIYILALKNINKINNPVLFTAWLNQICFHVCYDICKKNNADYQIVDDEFLESFHDTKISSNPESHAEINEERFILQKAIDDLPPLQRSIIVMRYFNNMKLADVADAMDISLSSVKRYLETARSALQSALMK